MSRLAQGASTSAHRIKPLEQVIDGLCAEIKARHVRRLTEGVCTAERGFVLSDILTNLERVSDHCVNVEACLTETPTEDEPTHRALLREYGEKYALWEEGDS